MIEFLNWLRAALRHWGAKPVCYIGGSEVLPPPLSAEEESEALARAAEGDDAARNRLIEHNLRLVVYIARKFENTGVGLEDLISIGTIGLIKAVGTFKPINRSSWQPMLHGASKTRF